MREEYIGLYRTIAGLMRSDEDPLAGPDVGRSCGILPKDDMILYPECIFKKAVRKKKREMLL